MAWDGNGTFTRTNGVNTGSGAWAADKAAATNILASRHDTHDQDLATGIQACLTKNGESKPTADFKPNADATYSLGSALLRWIYAYVSGGVKFVGASYTTTFGFTAPTGNRTINLPNASGTVTIDESAEYDNGNSGAAATVDFVNGKNQKITLTGDCTLTITAPAASAPGRMVLRVIQDATGSRALTFSSVNFADGINFPCSIASGDCWLTLETDGTTMRGQFRHRQRPITIFSL